MMECITTLSTQILEVDVIGRVLLLGTIIAVNILAGYWLIDRVGKRQAEENLQYIDDLRKTVQVLRSLL